MVISLFRRLNTFRRINITVLEQVTCTPLNICTNPADIYTSGVEIVRRTKRR